MSKISFDIIQPKFRIVYINSDQNGVQLVGAVAILFFNL